MSRVPWHVYVLRCADGTLYTGITTDISRRVAEHTCGGPRAARYLRGRGPLQLVWSGAARDRAHATRLEVRIKRLGRRAKEDLISGAQAPQALFAKD